MAYIVIEDKVVWNINCQCSQKNLFPDILVMTGLEARAAG